jgi:predicted dehydrogenase
MWQPSDHANYLVQPNGQPVREFALEGEDQILNMIENFSRAALGWQPVSPEPEEAVRTLKVLDALAQSAREGRVVSV